MWLRICVDVEMNGQVRGWSYERRSESGPDLIHVGGEPGPFDTPDEAFAAARNHAVDRFGEHLSLFD